MLINSQDSTTIRMYDANITNRKCRNSNPEEMEMNTKNSKHKIQDIKIPTPQNDNQ